MRISYLLPALCLAFAACETAPVEVAPVTMAQADFDQIFQRANASQSPIAAETALTTLVARTDLTDEQRAEALYLRAEKRRAASLNLPGAVADFEAFLAARPLDARAPEAERQAGFARTKIAAAEQRLSNLQTLEDWFDDKVLLGGLPEAAVRYRRSGLTPTERQVYTLREAGYICATGTGQAVHTHGAMPSYAQNLTWCPGEVTS